MICFKNIYGEIAMILNKEVCYFEGKSGDFETASQTLPSEFRILGRATDDKKRMPNMQFVIVPRTEDNLTLLEDMLIFDRNPVYGTTTHTIRQNEMFLALTLNMKEMPTYANFVDIYFNCSLTENNLFNNCEIQFLDNLEEMFTYKCEKNMKASLIQLGTLAKVSDGWKFYPTFEQQLSKDSVFDFIIKSYKEILL